MYALFGDNIDWLYLIQFNIAKKKKKKKKKKNSPKFLFSLQGKCIGRYYTTSNFQKYGDCKNIYILNCPDFVLHIEQLL